MTSLDPGSNGRTFIAERPDRRSVGELLRDSVAQSHAVVRGEVRVALAEASEELRESGHDALLAMLGAALGLLSVTLLIIAGVAAIAQYLPLWAALLIAAAFSALLTVAALTYARRENRNAS